MAELELKPCPFCGGKAEIELIHKDEEYCTYVVACYNDECSASVFFDGGCDTPEEAAEAWNNRTSYVTINNNCTVKAVGMLNITI